MKKITLFIAFLSAMIVGGLILQKSKIKQVENKNILRAALYFDISTFHFSSSNKGSYVNSSYVIPYVFEGLMSIGENEKPIPAVAYKIDISRDMKTYTFYLRDCKWSDGVEVTAYDFEYAWKKLITPNSKSITPLPELFYPIKNAEKFLLGNCNSEDVGINIIDEKTLSVELEYPAHYFLEIMSNPFLFPAPKHIAEKDPEWCTKEGFVCNGPFTLSKWHMNSEIALSKNPHYWDQEHVYLDGINPCICQNQQTALNLFEKGQLDWIGDPFMKISYDASSHFLNKTAPDSIIYFFVFNVKKHPFNNKKFRQAFSYAINRSAIVENVFHDSALPVMSILPVPLRLRNEPYFQDNNIALAQRAFKEALEEIGESIETLPEIELLYMPEVDMCKKICLATQDQWRKNLGVKISLRGLLGWNFYIDTIQRGDYDIAITGTTPPVFDPSFVLNIFKNKEDLCNRCNWENSAFKELLQKANNSLGDIERTNLLIEAEEILMEEMPIIPICSMNKRYAKNPKLQGEKISYLQFVDFKSAYFEDHR